MRTLSCVAIDDDSLFLMNLQVLIEEIEWLDLKATYTNPVQGATGVIKVGPDILFVDLEMPYMPGYDLVEWILPRLKFLKIPPKIVVISGVADKMLFQHEAISLHIPKHLVRSPESLERLLNPLRSLTNA